MKKITKILFSILIISAFLISGVCIYAYCCIGELDTKLIQNKTLLNNFNSKVNFYDTNDIPLVQTSVSGKTSTTLDELPDYVKNAFIAIEDKEFYNHKGLNFKRIIKATLNNLASGYPKEGGSTISQQLVKNVHLNSEKTIKRKIQEAFLTSQIERQYSKDEILETYLNAIYFGNNAIGIENASYAYFNCPAKDLTLEQSATLAGIIKSPSYYSPITNPKNCLKRRNLVLDEMLKENFITPEEHKKATGSGLNLSLGLNAINSTCFYQETIKEAQKILDLSEKDVALSNYKIFTYLDSDMQNNIIKDFQNNFTTKNIDSTLVVLDNKTSGVVSLVSSATNLRKRQPGSLIKPVLCYAPSFEEGILSSLSPINDSPISFGNWTPTNVDGKFSGYISTREALSKSKNIPAVKVLDYVGIEKAKDYAERMGIQFDASDNHLALSLGAMKYGVTPVQMAATYSTFANGGRYDDCRFIKKIEDFNGNVIYQHNQNLNKVVSEDTAYLVSDILKDTITKGTAKKLKTLPFALSAKTGTVGLETGSGNTDAWCASYNKNYTICAWIGNTTGNSKNNLTKTQNGGTISTNLSKIAWQSVKANEQEWIKKPVTIKEMKVDLIDLNKKHKLTLASENTPERFYTKDIFSSKFLPKEKSLNFVAVEKPKLSIKEEANQIVLTWDNKNYLTFDVYENDEKIKTDTSSPCTLPLKNGKNYYFIVAKNKFVDIQEKSDVVTMYKKPLTEPESIRKKIAKSWLFK